MPVTVYAVFYSSEVHDDMPSDIDLFLSGSEGKFEFIYANKLTALVSLQKEKNPVYSQQEVLAYASIVEKISKRYAILPMRYGSVVDSLEDVIALLQKNSESFYAVLDSVKNKEEYSLRLLFSQRHQHDTLNMESTEIIKVPPAILQGNTETKNYLLKKYQEHIVEENRHQYIEKIQSHVTQEIRKITEIFELKKRVTPALILDAVLLIERSAKDEILALASRIQSRYPEHNVILTGPWPPYNFTQIKIE